MPRFNGPLLVRQLRAEYQAAGAAERRAILDSATARADARVRWEIHTMDTLLDKVRVLRDIYSFHVGRCETCAKYGKAGCTIGRMLLEKLLEAALQVER